MNGLNFSLPEMSKVDFSISYFDNEYGIISNHNESHIHEECEIYLNLSGNVSFEVENHIYPISRGSVVITRPYEYHHCFIHSKECHTHYWITFSSEAAEEFLSIFFDREKGKGNLLILNEEDLEECTSVLNGLLSENEDAVLRRIGFLQLIYILKKAKRGESVGDMAKLPKDVETAIRFMDEHLIEDITIETLAMESNVSVNTLERHFKESLGLSPSKILRRKRINRSIEFLQNGESVTSAAMKSGFADYSNYIQLFRKQFGLTPLQYKKKFEAKR